MPTGDWEITQVHGQRTWQSKYGEMVSYDVSVKGPQGAAEHAELAQKPTSRPPEAGDSFYGELVAGRPNNDGGHFPPRLKRIQDPAAPKAGAPRPGRSPQERAEIVRQHSEDMALRLLDIELRLGNLADQKPITTELVEKYADWFDQDVKRAAERVVGGSE